MATDLQNDPSSGAAHVTLGPVLFNWAAETWRDFYFRIADEAPIGTVYVGEVICSKRAPLFNDVLEPVIARLQQAGKRVVVSSLSETVLKLDRKLVESVCASDELLVEANDTSALFYLRGRAHHIGPLLNVYNEESLRVLAKSGARQVCFPVELPATSLAQLCATARELGLATETQVFGRQQLALSARCYHARAHGRTKDSCLFVCENDPDGLDLTTLDRQSCLTVNGIQTMSHDYLSLIAEVPQLLAMGLNGFRLSPHSCDMVKVARAFDDVIHSRIATNEGQAILDGLDLNAPFANGFFYGKPGNQLLSAAE